MAKCRRWKPRKHKKNIGGNLMANSDKKSNIKKKILKIIAAVLVAIIPVSFLYSLILLVIEPTNLCVVENRQNI